MASAFPPGKKIIQRGRFCRSILPALVKGEQAIGKIASLKEIIMKQIVSSIAASSLLAALQGRSRHIPAAGFGLTPPPDNSKRRFVMKCITVAKTLTITATVLALSFSPQAKADDKGCSNASLQGTYGYTSTGTITSPPDIAGPIAEIGTQFFDGRGNTTATATLSSNGTLFPLTITGTYNVNPDCTGTLTLQVSPFGITVDVLFVIDDGWNEFRAIETDSGFVITRAGRKLYPGRNI